MCQSFTYIFFCFFMYLKRVIEHLKSNNITIVILNVKKRKVEKVLQLFNFHT